MRVVWCDCATQYSLLYSIFYLLSFIFYLLSSIISGGPSANGGGCEADDLDAVLHRAPQHYYPDIAERGLAMVWNPTNRKPSKLILIN
jgi:hypothetical protein